jgi:hypothetical protein
MIIWSDPAAAAATRIPEQLKDHRDLLTYLLWDSGRFSNREIGTQLGISYSNESRRIMEVRKKLVKDKRLRGEYQKISALIKV